LRGRTDRAGQPPPRLRAYAGLDKDLTINGADEKVEIWDRATWDSYRDQAEDDFANLDAPFTF
jgi:MraZ protein